MSEFDAEAVSAVEAPPAEYGVDTIQQSRPIDEDERRRLREEYGWVRTYFKLRPNDYRSVQRSLNQARIGATYDEYLADSLRYAMVAGVLGALLGLFVTYQLSVVGAFEGLANPLAGAPGDLVQFVAANRTLFGGGAITLGLGTLFGVGTWAGRYYYPVTVVSARRQNIDIVLPHAIVYVYALSHGGMSLVEAMRSLADAEDVYGEVAKEFEMIVTDIDLFGSDVYTALQNARNLTPSENLEQFLDDLIGVLDSGADATTFLETESETYLREAEEEQEDFLETLSLMAEVFVVGFVAAPLFLIVTLVVISLIGGNTIPQITMLVYVVIPLAMVAFLVLIDVLSQPFEQVSSVPDAGRYDRPAAPESADDADSDERVSAYTQRKRLLRLKALLLEPMTPIERRPLLSLLVTVPLSLLTVGVLVALGAVEVSLDAMLVRPIATTTGLFVLPFLVIGVPLSLFHELKRRRENEVARRFPDTLNILSSANKMGIPLTDALALVSRWSDGVVAEEIETVRNDITWNHDVTAALLAFGSRLHVPQLARTMKLLADGIRSSGDLSRVLSIAAEDTRNRAKMDRKRRRELSSYVAVVVIGFLVYLLVVVMLESSYLGPVSEVGAGAPSDVDNPVSFVDVPVNVYRAVFFHSALVMGVGSGLLAGKLAENDSLSGLKYGIGLVAITLVAFLVI